MGIYKININMIIYGGPYVHHDTGVTTSVTVEPVKHVTSSDTGTQVTTIFTTKTTKTTSTLDRKSDLLQTHKSGFHANTTTCKSFFTNFLYSKCTFPYAFTRLTKNNPFPITIILWINTNSNWFMFNWSTSCIEKYNRSINCESDIWQKDE